MGNFLDNPPFSDRAKTASDSNRRSESTLDNHYYLNSTESQHLKHIFTFSDGRLNDPDTAKLEDLAGGAERSLILINHCLINNWKPSATRMRSYADYEKFIIEAVRTSQSKTLEILWRMCDFIPHEMIPQSLFHNKLHKFCTLLLYLSCSARTWSDSNYSYLVSCAATFSEWIIMVAKTSNPTASADDLKSVVGVVNSYSPQAAKCFQTYLTRLFLTVDEPSSFKPYQTVTLLNESDILAPQWTGFLALFSDELQGSWKRLYTTGSDGLSFNRLEHSILGYDGPTCLIIRCNDETKSIFGVMCHERWKESNRFYGSSKNILFSLSPKLRIYRSKSPNNGNFQWLNSNSYGMPHGLGLGGTLEGFRVFIPDTLENCTALSACPTYELGRLVKDERFEIDALEVWGCGGDERVKHGLKAQVTAREVTEENLARARKVDKAQFFNNEFDKEFLLGNTMSHQKYGHDQQS